MARPYSNDLRERVAGAVASGRNCREVAMLFDVSVASVVKWSQRFRRTGSVAPGKMGGHRRPKIAGLWRDWLVDRMRTAPFTLRGLVSELADRGLTVDYHTVWNFVHQQGLSYKKRPSVRPSSKGRTWQDGGRGGRGIKVASTPSGLSSSTRRGRRPTWRRSADGQ